MNQSRSTPPFDGTFVVFLAVVGFVIGEGLATDLAGQLASLAFGSHHVVPGGVGAGATAFLRLWGHLGDPKLAWAPRARRPPARAGRHVDGAGRHRAALGRHRRRGLPPGSSGPGVARRSAGGGKPKLDVAEVERRMGRKAVERHTAALYRGCRCRQA